MKNDIYQIIGYATKAPSGHNSQPWRFSVTENEISIKPNFDAALPVVDSDNRELYISLGCAMENLLIAAAHFGYESRIVQCDKTAIRVALSKSNQAIDNDQFHQIERRQNNRSVYNGKRVANLQLEKLQSTIQSNNINLYFAEIGSSFAATLTQSIAKGNELQMSDNTFRDELLSWMRFNGKQVKKRGDGLSYKVFGNPPLPTAIAKVIVRQFLKPTIQNRGDMQKLASSSHLVLFTTKHNTTQEWIELGQLLQRFSLATTQLGIASAYCNQPCEVVSLAEELQKTLPIKGEYPTLILRIGYAAPTPYSPRKRIEAVLE